MKTNIKLIAAIMMATAMLFSACKKEEETSETPNTPPDVPATPTVTNATFTFDGQTVQLGSLSTKVKQFTNSYGTNGQRLVIDAASTEKPAGCTMNMPAFHIVIEQVGGDATWRIIRDSTYAYTDDMLAKGVQSYASAIWNYGRKQPSADMIPISREQLILTLLPRTTGRFSRSGLRVNSMRYRHDDYTEQYLRGGEAVVAYNPENVGWLYEHSAGIISIVVSLIHDAQEIAILNGRETLDIVTLNEAFQRMQMIHN